MDFRHLYLRRDGRIPRLSFWIGLLILAAVGTVVTTLILPLLGFGSQLGPKSVAMAATDPARFSALVVDWIRLMGWTWLALFALFAYPLFCLLVKRRHDRNSNGWDVLVFFAVVVVVMLFLALGFALTVEADTAIPFPSDMLMPIIAIYWVVIIYMLVVLGLLKGTDGANRYGPDPLAD